MGPSEIGGVLNADRVRRLDRRKPRRIVVCLGVEPVVCVATDQVDDVISGLELGQRVEPVPLAAEHRPAGDVEVDDQIWRD
jgi:hypothetical protein